jgi:hypothetical protein
MQQGTQVVVVVGRPEPMHGLGSLGLLLQAVQAFAGEGVQGIADGLRGTAQGGSDAGGTLALIAGQKDLTAAQGKGVGGAQALTQGHALGFGQRPDEQRRFHTSFYAPDIFAKAVV